MAEISVNQLTEGTVEGGGIFDSLMRAAKAHIQEEYSKNRIKGTEYSQVYTAAIQSVMQMSLELLLQKQRADKEAELLAAQIVTEGKKQAQLDAETALTNARTSLTAMEELLTSSKKALTDQQLTNATKEYDILVAQECKLQAEFDLLKAQEAKSGSEKSLLDQKVLTERAQVSAVGVDTDSVVGRQKALYAAQTSGYGRDAEQKTAKMMIDAFIAQLNSIEGVQPGSANLDTQKIGYAVQKLLEGVNAWQA